MGSFRRRTVISAVTLAAMSTVAPATAAPPDGSLRGLVLSGGCPPVMKSAMIAPRTPYLFAPVRLIGPDFAPTHTWLFPYSVTVTGEGLKARHLTPGVTYTRPGKAPREMVTCVFDGATKEDGPFTVEITGPVRGW